MNLQKLANSPWGIGLGLLASVVTVTGVTGGNIWQTMNANSDSQKKDTNVSSSGSVVTPAPQVVISMNPTFNQNSNQSVHQSGSSTQSPNPQSSASSPVSNFNSSPVLNSERRSTTSVAKSEPEPKSSKVKYQGDRGTYEIDYAAGTYSACTEKGCLTLGSDKKVDQSTWKNGTYTYSVTPERVKVYKDGVLYSRDDFK
jgi:hypothetical protein